MKPLFDFVCTVMQFCVGMFSPMIGLAAVRSFIRPRPTREAADPEASAGVNRIPGTVIFTGLMAAASFAYLLVVVGVGVAVRLVTKAPEMPEPTKVVEKATEQKPADTDDDAKPPAMPNVNPFPIMAGLGVAFVLAVIGRLWVASQGTDTRPGFQGLAAAFYIRFGTWKIIGMVFALGFSLLPLSALLLAFPALVPQESVLTDAVSEKRGLFRRLFGRLAAVVLGITVLLGLLALSVEIVSRLPLPPKGSFSAVAKNFLPAPDFMILGLPEQKKAQLAAMPPEARRFWTTPLHAQLPVAMVEQWQFVILTMYALDVLLLVMLGKVPLAYNLRNLRVRWLTNAMTAAAFAAVVALLAFLLAFVNGMNNMTQNTGVPGNVFVLSDGSTDEIFSNLGYGDIDNVERVVADEQQLFDAQDKPLLDDDDKELWRAIPPLRIKKKKINGKEQHLASKETYYSVNMDVPNANPPRKRFVQMRTLEDADVAAEVHNIKLLDGGRWFSSSGTDDLSRIECVLGEGVAGTLGVDFGKKSLLVGDVFKLGGMDWVVVGIMSSKGTTFGSEIWTKRTSLIFKPFGKDKYTTLVLRTEADTKQASRIVANYLSKKYTQQKLKAFSEPDYYAELTKTNDQFLASIIIVCVVMSIGGVFGMMTTMFASIAQRIKDIGVLRLLGFKRWQITVSFLLESLAIAFVGGLVGCLFAYVLANGRTSVSTLSSGGGGPGGKSIVLTILVDIEVVSMGLLFCMGMGRIGGLIPALSAMRMKILDSLR